MSPASSPGTLNDVVLTNPDSLSATLPKAWFADFLDVDANPFHDAVESILRAGITAGCAGGNYCGTAPVTRAQMAVLLLKAKHGSDFVPPPCTGLFDDVACPGRLRCRLDRGPFAGRHHRRMRQRQLCPTNPVRRDQMAVFLLKASLGSAYVPPSATGTVFTDVPASAFAADWIEDLYSRNVTGGCLTSRRVTARATRTIASRWRCSSRRPSDYSRAPMSHKGRSWAGLLILCFVALSPCRPLPRRSTHSRSFARFMSPRELRSLAQMPDGSLLGTTSTGGVYGGGTIFALEPDG